MDNFFSNLVLSDKTSFKLGRHFLFWFCCWMFMGLIYGFLSYPNNFPYQFYVSFRESFLFLPQHMLLSYGIIYFALPRYIFRNRYWTGLVVVMLLILGAAALSPVTTLFLVNPIREKLGLETKETFAFYSLMAGLRGTMTVAGFAVAIKLVKHWYFKKIENESLEKEKLRAELQLLRGQLHPHFIFNTLNSIYSMALKKSDDVPASILKLSHLLRYMFTECNDMTISLAKEIQVIQHYISLVKSRFADRLDLSVHISGDFEGKKIAPLLLLAFIENSFKYGTSEMLQHAWISLDLAVVDQHLKFKLINGKSEFHDQDIVSNGMGLYNVKKRLSMLYPQAHNLRISEDSEMFMVQLSLKLDKVKLPDAYEEMELPVSG